MHEKCDIGRDESDCEATRKRGSERRGLVGETHRQHYQHIDNSTSKAERASECDSIHREMISEFKLTTKIRDHRPLLRCGLPPCSLRFCLDGLFVSLHVIGEHHNHFAFVPNVHQSSSIERPVHHLVMAPSGTRIATCRCSRSAIAIA
jgi:hypothetical protein